jgi:hypothetical protein
VNTPARPELADAARTEARGWIEVVRLAERERRREAGEPLLQLTASRRALNTHENGVGAE